MKKTLKQKFYIWLDPLQEIEFKKQKIELKLINGEQYLVELEYSQHNNFINRITHRPAFLTTCGKVIPSHSVLEFSLLKETSRKVWCETSFAAGLRIPENPTDEWIDKNNKQYKKQREKRGYA